MSDTIPLDSPQGNIAPPEFTYIYKLIDPETLEIRYVGKSNDPEQRLIYHMSHCLYEKTYKARWLKSLHVRGLRPILEIVEKVPLAIWQEREMYWIQHCRSQGCPLTNTTDGGDGASHLTPEIRAIVTAKNKGKKRNPDAVAKTTAALRGRKRSPESIAKMVETKRGTKRPPFSEEWKCHLSEGHTGKKASPETLVKLSAFQKSRKHAPMSEEQKRKIGKANTGQKRSPETIARMVAAWERRRARTKLPPKQLPLWGGNQAV